MNPAPQNNRGIKDEKYENINLEEDEGVIFLRENSQLIRDDCLELITDLKEFAIDTDGFDKRVELLFAELMAILDSLKSGQPISDKTVESIESAYNKLLSIQEEIASIYTEELEESSTKEEEHSLALDHDSHDTDSGDDLALDKKRVSQKLIVTGNNEVVCLPIDAEACAPKPVKEGLRSAALIQKSGGQYNSAKNEPTKVGQAVKSIYSPAFSGNEIKGRKAELATWSKYITKEEIFSLLGNDFSLKAFTRYFDNFINSTELASTDVFERWLGESRASMFDYLKDLTLSEVDNLTKDPDLKQTLKINNIKYETYIRWLDTYQSLKNVVRTDQQTKFGELIALYVALDLVEKTNPQ